MRRQAFEGALVWVLLASVVVFGTVLRLQDPLSTRALAAEDPWSHVVFTKEWAGQGYFADSFQMGTEMYPPGMHAWLAAFVPFTGIDLHEFARIAPAFFGALAVLGMFVLGQRLGGPVAGLAAAFATAVMPEHIFRTELLFPTAFDLALLPLWMLGFHMAIHGQRAAGIGLFALGVVPLAVMHPWVVPLFAVPLAFYAALRAFRGAIPRSELWTGAGLLVPSIAFAMAFRWDESDTGFADFLAHVPGFGWAATAQIPGPLLFMGLLVGLGTIAAAIVWLAQVAPTLPRFAGIAFGVSLLALVPLLTRNLPPDVNYLDMIGPVTIGLALAGFALAVVRPSALGDLAIVISLWLFPLTAVNLFDSPFWPQRTVAYLCVGVALLAGAALAQVPALAARLARTDGARARMGTVALVAVGLALAGSAVASPPDTYTWYRLYNDQDFEGFEHVGAILDKDPASRIFVYTWQPALLVKAVTEPEHVWYGSKSFQDGAARSTNIDNVDGRVYFLVDKHTTRAAEQGKANLGFLEGSKYHLVYESPGGGVKLYEVDK